MFITTTLNHSNLTSALSPTLRETMGESAGISPVHPPIHTKYYRMTVPDVTYPKQESITTSAGRHSEPVDQEVTVYEYDGRTVEVKVTKNSSQILDTLV